MSSRIPGGNSLHHRPGGARGLAIAAAALTSIALIFAMIYQATAAEPANSYFQSTWQRTDDPVASGQVSRTWMWGPDGFTGEMTEEYSESPGGDRTVQYFDKSRMEITDPSAPMNSVWYVTNGLLVVELVTGRMQMGDNSFTQYNPATANVAGDQGGGVPASGSGPTYATMAGLLDDPALSDGATITQRVDRSGNVTIDPSLASFGVTAAYRVTEPGIDHQVASPFWEFMNSSGTVYENGSYLTAPMFLSPFYATGFPITEAYWANVSVAGVQQDVLLQCFERRCLTYTPGNDPGWQVEAGNVGQHYYSWRYGQLPDDPTATPPVGGTEEPSPTEPPTTGTPPASPTADPSAEQTATPPTATVEPLPSATIEPGPSPTATEGPVVDYDYAGKFGEPFDPDSEFDDPVSVAIADDGTIYVLEFGSDRVQKFSPNGYLLDSFGEPGTADGQLNDPHGIAVHGDYVYVADSGNDRIQKFTVDGDYVLDWDGSDRTGGALNGPLGVAVDSAGNVYVTDTQNNRIQRFTASGDFMDEWSGGSDGTSLDTPVDIAVRTLENLQIDLIFVVDWGNSRIQTYDSFNSNVSVVSAWGESGTANGEFQSPFGIGVNDDFIYVADTGNNRIQKFDRDGNFLRKWGELGNDRRQFDGPFDVAVAPNGRVVVADLNNNRIQKFGPRGGYVDSWVDGRRGRFGLGATAMTLDQDGNVYVIGSGRVQKFDADGRFLREIGAQTGPGDLDAPTAIVASPNGNLYVADFDHDVVMVFAQDGEYLGEWNGNVRPDGVLDGPIGLALDDAGYVYVLEIGGQRIQKFQQDGGFEAEWNLTGVAETPIDIAIVGDRLYLVDAGSGFVLAGRALSGVMPGSDPVVKVFDLIGGDLLGEFDGDGRLKAPYGIGIDADGYVYLADIELNTILKFTSNGVYLTTIGELGSGNGQFSRPTDVEIDTDGTLYVLDTRNFRVQMLEPK